jgi:Lrp/AsnC family transcriptional regulator, leucine-responsive regulatory protein
MIEGASPALCSNVRARSTRHAAGAGGSGDSLGTAAGNVQAESTAPTAGGAISCDERWSPTNKMPNPPRNVQLDAIDRAILDELQRDGRISNVDLAQRVHLSPSACLRRVKQLEDAGVIAQYAALLNPKAVGRHGTCFTIINLESMNNPQLEAFEQAVRDSPEILDCYYVTGSNDYLLRFAYRDAEDLERFHTEVLMRLPGVARSNSMLVLRTVKKTTALPL